MVMKGNSGSELGNLRYGLYIPNFGKSAGYARELAELAREAEKSGWDGCFLWDHLVEWDRRVPITDSFTALAAIAMATKRIRIGTTVTPLPRLKPWIVARQVATLDHLSNGRMILGVGLGVKESCDYERFGEVGDNRVLAEKVEESLEIITGLWSGRPFSYKGKHYTVGKSVFLPKPKQIPRVPIWVGGFWPNKGPFKRAARWDGVLPLKLGPSIRPGPKDLRNILSYIKSQRTKQTPFDAAIIGWGTGTDRKKNAKKITLYLNAGMTWWLESLYLRRDSSEKMRRRVRSGPPSLPIVRN
jgi:hypothetical protein